MFCFAGRAVVGKHVPVVRLLLQRGASLRASIVRGWTVFHYAVLAGCPVIVAALLEALDAAPEQADVVNAETTCVMLTSMAHALRRDRIRGRSFARPGQSPLSLALTLVKRTDMVVILPGPDLTERRRLVARLLGEHKEVRTSREDVTALTAMDAAVGAVAQRKVGGSLSCRENCWF